MTAAGSPVVWHAPPAPAGVVLFLSDPTPAVAACHAVNLAVAAPALDPFADAEPPLLALRPGLAARFGKVAVAGVGPGGHAAVRLAVRHPHLFPVAASVDGLFDLHDWHGRGTALDDRYATRERCRQDTATLRVNPAAFPPFVWLGCDPASEAFRGNDRFAEKLTAFGLPFAADFDTTGNRFPAMAAFVAASLKAAGRSLL